MLAYIFAAVVALFCLGFSLKQAFQRLRDAEETVAKAAVRRQAQVDRIRRAARTTLGLAREIREAERRQRDLEAACGELEGRLLASNGIDRRLYVLDDRRTPSDLTWVVRVANPDYARRVQPDLDPAVLETWRRGRRFLVWALDERKARDKVYARFPEHKGFYIQGAARREG
ncbi:hypothetical protein [Azospirillum sp. ST 5-10]|uniref:hypothetical protein n=1 Tax=unclassified Azospirillum TaxID=2630922 RepID=UPI003F4A68F4